MMGYNHVTCGLAAGLATLPVAPVHGPGETIAWVVCLGGAALLPDLDTAQSSAARMWGPVSRVFATGVGKLVGGHRWGTHDVVLAPLVVAGLAALALLTPVTTGVVVAVTVGLALTGLSLVGAGRVTASANALVSAGAGVALVHLGADQLSLLPLVLAAGVVVHVAGDAISTSGVPVPVAWIWTGRRVAVARMRVNSRVETRLLAPLLSLLVAGLVGWNLHRTGLLEGGVLALALGVGG